MPSPAPLPEPGPRPQGLSFVADDIHQAIADIRERLGSEAVVLDIRRVPARGLGRLWQRPRIEVVACPPEPKEPNPFPRSEPAAVPADGNPDPALAPASATPVDPADSRGAHPGRPGTRTEPEGAPAAPMWSARTAAQRYARAGVAAAADGGADDADLSDAPVPPPGRPGLGARLGKGGEAADRGSSEGDGGQVQWRSGVVFERLGLIPLCAERVLAEMQDLNGPGRSAPETLAQELALARTALKKLWKPLPPENPEGPAPLHVFLGTPGCGKTTALCKWLAQTVLLEGKPARVWRLDGRTTNPSELVSLYGEILGVPVERVWNGRPDPAEVGFVDLGAGDFRDRESLETLAGTVARLSGATIHLVLNAAYTVPLLMAQVRAFSSLAVDDLVLTHLDEEPGWGKLWNLVLGTNCPLGRLSAGQNIPGQFTAARPELLAPSLFGAGEGGNPGLPAAARGLARSMLEGTAP